MEIQSGLYKGKLVGHGVAISPKGSEYMFLTFEIDTKVDNGTDAYLDQTYTRDVYFYLTEKAKQKSEEDLIKLGFNGNYADPMFRESLYSECLLDCRQEEYDGKTVYKFYIAELGNGKFEKKLAPQDILRRLNAQFKAKHPKTFSEAPKAASAPAQAAVASVLPGDDDIPF